MLKVLELFGGIGACTKALENLGIEFELVDYVEIDKFAVKSFNAIHNTNFQPQDICEWDKNLEVDLIMHGSPCFVKGTSILTDKSYKNVEDIKVGDCVLTHTNQYQKVLKIGYTDNKQTYKLKVKNCLEVQATENHPFYCIERKVIQHHRNVKYKYSESKWKELKDITTNDFIGINIPQKERNDYNLTPEQCYLLGRYVADGHLYNSKRQDRKNGYNWFVVYSIGAKKLKDFETHITTYKYSKALHSSNCYRVMIWDKKLVEFIKKYGFGEGAINKDIPQMVLDLPKSLAKYFLDGYLSGDGSYNKTTKVYRATTISKKLVLKLQLLVAKIFNQPSSVTFSKRSSKHIIENRIVNQHNTYSIQYKITPKKAYSFIKDNKLWFKVSKIEKANKERVYNLEVEKDNSYTANNLIVHNCQDFSICGKQAGGDKESKTRSSLMYETIRIVEKLKPKYVIWENVKNLLSKKHRHNFDNYLEIMEHSGYNNYYQILNAKDYGVPQNRERVFTVSIRKDVDNGTFEFPKPFKLELKLKDMLEDEVDEKYFLSDKMIEYIIADNKKWSGNNNKSLVNKSIASTINTGEGSRRCDASNYIVEGLLEDTDLKYIESLKSENRQSKQILIKEATKKGYAVANEGDGVYIDRPEQKRGVVQKGMIQTLKTSVNDIAVVVTKDSENYIQWKQKGWFDIECRAHKEDKISGALNTRGHIKVLTNDVAIRRLTPLECFRLMGFDDDSFEKASKVCTNTQLYKQAGNSIVVNVIQLILNQLLLVKNKKVERGVQTSIYDFIKEK